jgi:fatty-acid peroxygenase
MIENRIDDVDDVDDVAADHDVAPEPAVPIEDDRVTVVVATRDRRRDLAVTLGRHRAPVILVDNGSRDGTAAMVRERYPAVTVIQMGTNAGAFGRTVGARAAGTEFIAFADDDSWWSTGSLRAAADLLAANPGVAAVAGSILVGPEETPDPFCRVLAQSPLPASSSGHPTLLGFVACATMVRRQAFLDVGGFDDVVRFPGEEERVALDLVGRGHELIYAPHVVIHHHPSASRSAPAERVRAVTRSALLTAVQRLPWNAVLRRAGRAARAGGPQRLGLWDATRELPRALSRRRTVGPAVRDQLALLDRGTEPGGDEGQRPADAAGRDRTLELIRRGYRFTGALPATSTRIRLAGRGALVITGTAGVRTFYGTPALRRRGAVPLPVRGLLFGPGAVHGLDGAEHRHRKAMFTGIVTPDAVQRLAELADREWTRALDEWRTAGEGEVFATAVVVFGAAVQRWAGLASPDDRSSVEMSRIVDGFGVLGPPMLRAWLGRFRSQRWARGLIRQARRTGPALPDGSPLWTVANATGPSGVRLPSNLAATELLNILRPTVAVAWLAAFGALALSRSPEWSARIAAEPDGFPAGPVARACAHETRRWAPFVPVLASRADRDLELPQGRLRRGERLVLNVHATDHDPASWPDPGSFDPGRFLPDDTPSRSEGFVPQGGGDVATGHRCPGEPIAVELLALTLRRLSRLGATLPDQDLGVDLRRMPTRPASGVRLSMPAG